MKLRASQRERFYKYVFSSNKYSQRAEHFHFLIHYQYGIFFWKKNHDEKSIENVELTSHESHINWAFTMEPADKISFDFLDAGK